MKSASASLWQADTIFGHLCWSLLRRKGEDALKEFLEQYRNQNPVILVSDGFPSDFIVRPLFLMHDRESEDLPKTDRIKRYRGINDSIQSLLMTVDDFLAAINGQKIQSNYSAKSNVRVVSKNKIDRSVNTAGGGSGELFDFTEYCIKSVDIYWRIAEDYVDMVRQFLDDLRETGYGKRKSAGYGQLEIQAFDPFDRFDHIQNANGFVSLSNFTPFEKDPVNGYWQKMVKYGKLGEEGASSQNPFKAPLLMLNAGSCFYDSPVRPWYGRVVEGLSRDWPSVQYGFAFPVNVTLPENGAESNG
jgi:CRISPR-associated protein Csm4